tara:strand:+ start:789 stop:1421 length:633 start_codon:yes stop_codon:yes gene_type:complete
MIGSVGKIGGIGAAGTGNASLVNSSNFYFNGTDQYATVLTDQTVSRWSIKTIFVMPALGAINVIADSAGDSSIYVDAAGHVQVAFTNSSSALETHDAGAVAAGDVVDLEVTSFVDLILVVVLNGAQMTTTAPLATQAPFTHFASSAGLTNHFTGYINSFRKGQHTGSFITPDISYENNYSFNEGSGTTFIDSISADNATITNLGSGGGGW